MNAIKNKLKEVFNIQTREDLLTILLFIHSFSQGISLIFLLTASYGLFIAIFNVEILPYIYISSAGMIAVVRFVHLKLEQRISFFTLIIFKTGFLLFSIEIFYLCLRLTGSAWVVIALVIWHNVLVVLADLEFWGLTNHLLSVRQKKRIYGLAGSGTAVATIIGGLSVPGLAKTIGVPNLLLISAFGILSSLFVLVIITRKFGDQLIFQEEKQEKESRTLSELLKNPYLKLVFCFAALSVFGYYFLDYIFFDQVGNCYSDENQTTGFLGLFFAVCSFLAFINSSFLYGRIITRYGLGLITAPIIAVIGSGLSIAAFFGAAAVFFWLIIGIRLLDNACRNSFENPSVRILFQPLPQDRQIKSHTFSVNIIQPVAGAFAGFMLLILTSYLSFKAIHLIYVMLFILSLWIFTAILLRREYIKVLKKAIMKQRAEGTVVPAEGVFDSDSEFSKEIEETDGLIDITDESLVNGKDDFDFDFDHDAETGVSSGYIEDFIRFEDILDELLGDDETISDSVSKTRNISEMAEEAVFATDDDNGEAFDPDETVFEPLRSDEELFGIKPETESVPSDSDNITVSENADNYSLSDEDMGIEEVFEDMKNSHETILDTDKKVMLLNSADIFSSIPYKYLAKIASVVKVVHVRAGEEIVRKGNIGKSMYIVADGQVGVYDGDRELEVLDRGPIEEMAVLNPKTYAMTVKAIKDTHLLRLDENRIYDVMSEHIELVREIIRVLCKKMAE